jgi:hypothetical protein
MLTFAKFHISIIYNPCQKCRLLYFDAFVCNGIPQCMSIELPLSNDKSVMWLWFPTLCMRNASTNSEEEDQANNNRITTQKVWNYFVNYLLGSKRMNSNDLLFYDPFNMTFSNWSWKDNKIIRIALFWMNGSLHKKYLAYCILNKMNF